MVTNMDFAMSDKAQDYQKRLTDFMVTEVLPAEESYDAYRAAAGPGDFTVPPVVEELKASAKKRGLWNLFLPDESGLTNLEYAPLAEISGWSTEIAPEAINCAAPDTGNMETLHLFATEAQRRDWLEPLLAGEIRSGFSMTEPAVASSDARNIETLITRDGDEYVINGRKWWTSGAGDPRCKIMIFMGKTDPNAPRHSQQSMVLVPMDTPGVEIKRMLPVFGEYDEPHGHGDDLPREVRAQAPDEIQQEGLVSVQRRMGVGRHGRTVFLGPGTGDRLLVPPRPRGDNRGPLPETLMRLLKIFGMVIGGLKTLLSREDSCEAGALPLTPHAMPPTL